jgi:5-methylcytosine-specific restriction endonuclease McrA
VRKYRAANAEAIDERRRARRAEDPERYRAERKERYYRNHEAELESRRRYAVNNPDDYREAQRRWALKNPDKVAEYVRRYRASHPEVRLVVNQNRRGRMAGGKISQAELSTLDDGTCALCSKAIDPALQWPHPMSRSLDHIIPLASGGEHAIKNVQWAHLVCNQRKGRRAS